MEQNVQAGLRRGKVDGGAITTARFECIHAGGRCDLQSGTGAIKKRKLCSIKNLAISEISTNILARVYLIGARIDPELMRKKWR